MRELYCKEVIEKNKKCEKSDIKKEELRKIEESKSDDEFTNYVENEASSKDAISESRLELSKLEREVNMIFEEFEEEANSFLRDSRKRKAERDYKEMEDEIERRRKAGKEIPKPKFDLFESFIKSDRPALLKQIDDVKGLKVESSVHDRTKDQKILQSSEFKSQIDDILSLDIEKKARKHQEKQKSLFNL